MLVWLRRCGARILEQGRDGLEPQDSSQLLARLGAAPAKRVTGSSHRSLASRIPRLAGRLRHLPVRCPQVEARHAAVGSPFFPDRVDLAGTRQMVEPIDALNCGSDAEVTDLHDVRALEGDQQ